ncbi:MAG: sulfatase-like hydrolase/transferase [Sandaracinaceae bacterium]|nr:sulfatase-like hydrolase/transferase [Sandaracinaceae bacterium]
MGDALQRTWVAALVAALALAAADGVGLGATTEPGAWPSIAWRLALLAVVLASAVALPLAVTGRAGLWLARRARRAWVWTLPSVALALPWVIFVSVALFSGGSMRRLPHRGLGIVLTAAVLTALVDVGCRAARRYRRRVRPRPAVAAAGLVVALFAVLGLASLNRAVLPGLYEYLHATLVALAFLVAFVAADARPRTRRPPLVAVGVLTALAILGAGYGLSRGRAIRAALGRPEAPAARAMLALVGRVIAPPPAPSIEARRPETVRSDDPGLPSWPGAHVLLVTVDALRADRLGVYGNRRGLTPAIDALARDGVVFEHASTQAPHSSYSLCSLMASEYLHETVQLRQAPPTATLASALGAAGYRTAALYPDGIFHTHGERLTTYRDARLGFETADPRWVDAERRTDAALALVDAVARDDEPPSLLWVHYFDAHEPYRETSLGTSLIDRYDGEVRNVDRAVDRLVREARRRLARDVVVVLTADHGEELRDHGGLYHGSSLYEEQVHVPLVVNAPGLAARRVRAAVELVDVAPTLLAGVGVSAPASMRGDDLRALMAGEPLPLAPAMSAVGELTSAFDGRWKLIADLHTNVFQLYDLERDPRERQNLVDARPEELARLHGQLRAWLGSLSAAPPTPGAQALELARLGDIGAAPALAAMLVARRGSTTERAEAARELGSLGGPAAPRALLSGLRDEAPEVAAESAIALGELGDRRARRPLLALLEDGARRSRAAFALARLGDAAAVPPLVEVLEGSEDRAQREQAAQWLGRLGDPRAYDALVAALDVVRVRRYAAEALGRLGDPRALPRLLAMLDPDMHLSVHVGAMLGLGRLGSPESIEPLARFAVDVPEVLGTTEALVRAGALTEGAVGGVDFAPGLRGARGCRRRRSRWDEPFAGRTTCGLDRPLRARVRPAPESPEGYVMFVRGRGVGGPARLSVRLGDGPARSLELGPRWIELRVELDPSEGGARRALLEPESALELDHLLIVPRGAPPEEDLPLEGA